jgi:PEP-CTERM motif
MISDGNVTMTSDNAVLIYTQLSTNSFGQINAWAIAADLYTDGIPTYEVGVFSGYQPGVRTDLPPYDARDYTEEFADLDGVQVYIESNGTLANSPDNQWVATPEPSTWAMMLLGFGGLGYAGYRRAREPRAACAARREGTINNAGSRNADRRGATAMTRETQHDLYQVLEAHKFDLEITRGVTSGPNLEVLDRRIEATRLLLEWLSQALEPHPEASPAVQMPLPSSSPG